MQLKQVRTNLFNFHEISISFDDQSHYVQLYWMIKNCQVTASLLFSTADRPPAVYSKRPKGRCPFCSKLIAGSQLTRHLKAMHKTEEEVSFALQQPKMTQKHLFYQLMKRGLHAMNRGEVLTGKQIITRVRNQGSSETVICSICKGAYSK